MAVGTATAIFTGAEDSVAVTWVMVAGSAFTAPPAVTAGVNVSDGGGPVAVDVVSVTTTGATVNPSARFTGTIELIAEGP